MPTLFPPPIRSKTVRMLAILVILAAMGAFQAPTPLASMGPADIELGKRLFQNNCAVCHGIDGSGSSGPSLRKPKFLRAADDEALVNLITTGIPGAGMPPSWHLRPNGQRMIAAYVRSIGQVEETPVPGDPVHGRAVFRNTGCNACHIVGGEGTGIGPELTEIGARRTAAVLRQAIAQPESTLPMGFVLVRAQPKNGPEVRGIRLNEDSFTIQVKDPAGQFHSFRKQELSKLEKETGKTIMPSYANSLSKTDTDDLVAYLAGLRGAR